MPDPSSRRSSVPVRSFVVIGAVLAAGSGAFAYTAGWLSLDRLTPARIIAALAPPTGPALGHRRNHAKGICFTGVFESSGGGAQVSKARVFLAGVYPALGRFNLGTPDPNAPDSTVRVRGMGLQIRTPDGETWRTAMINAPVFPVSTPEGFYELLKASHAKEPDAMKLFIAAHPEFGPFGQWANAAPWTPSYAEDRYNSLDAFILTSGSGAERAARWSLAPQAEVTSITQDELAKRGPNYLEQEIAERVAKASQRWTMTITLAEPGDPTSDPSKAWPADRKRLEVGTLVVTEIEAERDGPCRDVNFDPTILPDGVSLSDDPFPPARSSAYARSYDLRASETKYYPYHINAMNEAGR